MFQISAAEPFPVFVKTYDFESTLAIESSVYWKHFTIYSKQTAALALKKPAVPVYNV